MSSTRPTISSVTVTDELHLLGGLRAGTHRDGSLLIWPTTEGSGIQCPHVTDKGAYRTELVRYGLDLVGWEEISDQHTSWNISGPRGLAVTIDDWPAIAHAARTANDLEAAELARNVAFALRAASNRIRDISHAYGWQCTHVVLSKTKCGVRFSNVEAFDLYLALHAFLTEASSVRDYLARFIARRVLQVPEPDKIGTMKALNKAAKSGVVLDGPLVREILKICDKNNTDGWMVRLGQFRDRIVHEAPISKFSQSNYLVANPVTIGHRTLPAIYVGVPSNPFEASGQFVDALQHFRSFMLRLLEFSKLVVAASPIRPEVPRFTDADLRA